MCALQIFIVQEKYITSCETTLYACMHRNPNKQTGSKFHIFDWWDRLTVISMYVVYDQSGGGRMLYRYCIS